MSSISIRRARAEDIDTYLELQGKRWKDDNAATKEQLQSRFKTYPEGMLVAEREGEIVGMVYAMKIPEYDETKDSSWYDITHNGFCDNHDPEGNTIFGVDLSTAPGVGGIAGDMLLAQIGVIAIRDNMKWCMLGGRMPGYHQYKDQMTAEEYLRAKDVSGKPLDRQVRYYTSIPGLKAVKAMPEYFHDPDSCDYGVLLRWKNPFWNKPLRGVWSSMFPQLLKLETLYQKLF